MQYSWECRIKYKNMKYKNCLLLRNTFPELLAIKFNLSTPLPLPHTNYNCRVIFKRRVAVTKHSVFLERGGFGGASGRFKRVEPGEGGGGEGRHALCKIASKAGISGDENSSGGWKKRRRRRWRWRTRVEVSEATLSPFYKDGSEVGKRRMNNKRFPLGSRQSASAELCANFNPKYTRGTFRSWSGF